MPLVKANLIKDKGACAMAGAPAETLKDVYVANVDAAGVMLNSKSNGDGIPKFIPIRFVAEVDFLEPFPPAPAMPTAIAMPRVGGGFRRQ